MLAYPEFMRALRLAAIISGALFAVFAVPRSVGAQASSSVQTQNAGKYAVALRLPPEGLYAEKETDVEFHVADASQDDPVQGAPPIVNAKIMARVTMPSMAVMPAQAPKTHSEGVPGDYGVVLYFPHGGEYQVDLTITPPGNRAFTVSYKVPVGDAQAVNDRKPQPKPYTLEVISNPRTPKAGQPAMLNIVIRSRDTRQPVTHFDTVHTKQIHFMVVSADMQHFAHEHPVSDTGGKFTLEYAFPTGGEYHLFADVAPKGSGSQILMQPIRVNGSVSSGAETLPFTPSLADTAGGVTVALLPDPAKLPVGRSLNVAFSLKDTATGAPIMDLEPYLGAMAHLMLIHQDGVTFVHSHPDESDATNGHKGTVTFLARFPKPGFYRGWLQFQRNGKVETAVFTWQVGSGKRQGQ